MSKLIECPTCKQQVSSGAASCPHCGETIRKNKPRSVVGGFVSLGLGIVLCVVLCALSSGTPDDPTIPVTAYIGVMLLIFGIVGACICFTSPSK